MNLTEADRALAAGIAAAHPIEPANDSGRDFHVLVTPVISDGATVVYGYTQRYVDSIEAACHGRELLGDRCGKVVVRPAVERTYLEGRARWPEPLHEKAFMDAWRGWQDAARSGGAEVPTRLFVITARGEANAHA